MDIVTPEREELVVSSPYGPDIVIPGMGHSAEKSSGNETTGEKFAEIVKSDGLEVAMTMARFSVDPTTVNFAPTSEAPNPEIIPEILSQVKTLDPEFENKEVVNEDDLLNVAILAAAKAEAVSSLPQVENTKWKGAFKRFASDILDKTGSVIAGTGGKKAMAWFSGLLVVATGCSPIMQASEPLQNNSPAFQTQMAQEVNQLAKQYVEEGVVKQQTNTPTEMPTAVPTETQTPEPANTFHPYEGLTYFFDPESQKIVDEIQKDYGVKILMPVEYNNEKSKQWSLEQIKCIAESIKNLPPTYFGENQPKEILLLKSSTMPNEWAVGGYTSHRIYITIRTDFDINKNFSDPLYKKIYQSHKAQLEAALLHEWTHGYTYDMNPQTMQLYEQMTGWSLLPDGKTWVNSKPGELKQLYWGYLPPPNPWEDIAVSVEQMTTDPQSVPADRIQFFLMDPDFRYWKVMTPYFGG